MFKPLLNLNCQWTLLNLNQWSGSTFSKFPGLNVKSGSVFSKILEELN